MNVSNSAKTLRAEAAVRAVKLAGGIVLEYLGKVKGMQRFWASPGVKRGTFDSMDSKQDGP